MKGNRRNFTNFQSLSLLVDTSGGFNAVEIEISILDDYGIELK